MSEKTEKVYVLFTMDVEPVSAKPGTSGPKTEDEGRQYIRQYQDFLQTCGYPATYFVHPDVTDNKPEFFHQLKNEGSELGLHLHTSKYAASPRRVELGGLTRDEQRNVLQQASANFQSNLGFRPTTFRPGCFSANDATIPVLVELGFVGGGVSIPGRIWPEVFCVWAGACLDPHYANEAFRQSPGKLPFVNIPLSVDITGHQPQRHPLGFYHFPDLRPGGVYSDSEPDTRNHREMLRNILRRLQADNPPVKTIVIDVHNDRDFNDTANPAGKHFHTLLENLEPEIQEMGWQFTPATISTVIDQYQTVAKT